MAYQSLVHSQLEYASAVRDLYTKDRTHKIEMVQTHACPDPGNFVRGGGGGGGGQGVQVSLTNKSSDFFFLVLSLFYRGQMVNFKEIYRFSRFQRGSNIFQGVQLFPGGGGGGGGGGVNLIIPYRNPYNL